MITKDKAWDMCRDKAMSIFGEQFCREHNDSALDSFGMDDDRYGTYFLGIDKEAGEPQKISTGHTPFDYHLTIRIDTKTGDMEVIEKLLP